MISATFTHWVKALTGHAINNNNLSAAESVVNQQAKSLGLTSNDFCQRLMANLLPVQPFIDAITTHESYFFRHLEMMDYVVKTLMPQQMAQATTTNILSLPCAQGEEPWSLAMLMAEQNIPASKVSIYGLDIAASSISAAKKGLYSTYMLRNTPNLLKQKYFQKVRNNNQQPVSFRLNESLNHFQPSFHQANLFQQLPSQLPNKFHIIFCQNVLIYFNQQDQQRALKILYELLAPDGWLFVDSSEAAAANILFQRAGPNLLAAFQRKAANENSRQLTATKPLPNKSPYQPEYLLSKRAIESKHQAAVNKSSLLTHAKGKGLITAASTNTNTRPKQTENLLSKAQQAYQKKQFILAIELFEQVINKQAKGKEKAYLGLAKVFADQDDKFAALEFAEAALNNKQVLLNSEVIELYFILGNIKQHLGMKSAAKQHFEDIRNLNPVSPLAKCLDDS